MTTISYTEARDRLASVWDQAVSSREPVVIDRRGHESVVLVPAGEWRGMVETAHLLRSPANARRLLGALNRLDQGKGRQLTLEALAAKTGIA
ncbi:MAG: type II toxin-antitoxin system prevent-host-death family antitoxin [Verrucomicrobia bacterium]|jgi:antitoxin YefM|nr:type II toxin-antitoxin system prevent-host-death family antitoxin [Verrucomicrobiota bacterium]